jgi:hypothetical protein
MFLQASLISRRNRDQEGKYVVGEDIPVPTEYATPLGGV